MKRFLAFLCMLAMVLGVVNPAVFAAENNDVQTTAPAGAEEIIVLEADASNITVDRDTIIDLNGHNIDGVTVLAGTLYCMDSQTADYTVADGVYGHVTNVEGTVKAAEGYLQVSDSFHAVNLDIYAMTLRAADVGVYYKSNFAADEVVAAQVESFGVALSVVTAPNASNLDTYCGYSEFTGFEAGEGANSVGTSTLLKGIMKPANGDNKNAKNAAMPVYGRAYIKTSEGYVFGETVKRSLQEQVEAIDGVWEKLTDSQKTPVLSMLEDYTAVMEGWNIPNIRGIQVPGVEGEIEMPIEVATENGIVTEDVTVSENGVSVTVPAGTKLAEGVTALTLTVTPVEAEDTGLTLKEDRVLIPMDVHVEGLAADNAQSLTISLGKIMPENLNMGNYTVYHVENGKANEMTLIPVDAEFTAHNQYKYSLDGELTLYMASFSVVAAEVDEENAWNGDVDTDWYTEDAQVYEIRNADQLAGFNKLVSDGNAFGGKTVKLLSNLNFGGKENANNKETIWYPIGYWKEGVGTNNAGETVWYTYGGAFSGTFDGNGNTISNIHQNTWALDGNYGNGYWDEAMGLFGYISGGTVKNLTVEGFTSEGEFTPTGVIAAYASNSTFENISLTNCDPCVYNTGNGGIVGIGGNSDDPDTYKLTFNNITIDNTNKITALWGSWDVACGGLVGMFRGAGRVNMTNCHVAAQIDVYNDVCGNYQYYWYRYAGMLIGTNKNMTTDKDGYTVPETSKFHAENCTVHFGTWNDYYYCELVENSLASYTHDHQFSRLTEIADVSEIQDGEGNWNQTGNFIVVSENQCYHVRKDDNGFYLHNHDDYNRDGKEDKETVNGEEIYVENNRCVFLPFNQLFTGYGWGVKHIPIYDDGTQNVFEGVTILPREVADSVVKFDSIVAEGTAYAAGTTLTIGDLFAANAQAEVAIDIDNVQVTVSPADETSTVTGTYVANTADWTKGYLVLVGSGAATITITDYNFCKETVLPVTVNAPTSGDTTEAYVKVTEEPADWSGDYLIVYEAGNVAFNGSLATLDAGQNRIGVTISNGKIVAEDSIKAIQFTIAKSGDAYTIKSASGKYIGNPDDNNDLDESATTEYTNTITLNNGELKIEASGGLFLQYNATNSQDSLRFRYYKDKTQKAIALYKLTTDTNAEASCDHAGASVKVTSASCTNPGKVVINCTTCCEEVSSNLPAWGHSYDEGVVTTEPTCTEAGEKTYTCVYCSDTKTEMVEATGHKDDIEDNKCDVCGADLATNGWVLVTDASTLEVGDKIVVVANNADFALSTTQNTNNRGQVAIEKSGNIIVINDDVQVLTLETGAVDGTFGFNTGNGYLYAASSGSNHLKTKAELDANGSWKIEVTAAGVATIKAQGTYTRNWLRYNSTNNPPIFSAYGSGQADIAIYKLTGEITEPEVPACEHTNTTTTSTATCTEAGVKTVTCTDCNEVISTTNEEATGHTYTDGACSVCGATEGSAKVVATFAFGANGSASHSDGSSKTSYSETADGYTLSLTGGTQMYTGARDAKGNSCIKLGSGSSKGVFKFTVPEDVTSVKIYIAGYKTSTAKISINGGATQTVSPLSNNGEYFVIEIDTSVNKTVELTTVSGGLRAMVNTIEFLVKE